MLIKWVACRAVDREAFDRGQRAWSELRGFPGFRGQCGGWSRRDPRLAHIFAGWADESSYRTFMSQAHDVIAAAQSGSYVSIDVRLFDAYRDIGEGFVVDSAHAAVLRLAHCHVDPDRWDPFVAAQTEAWNRATVGAPGMLGATFARRGRQELLVLSQWRSAADHFTDLRERSGAAVDLEPLWTVPR